jgi:hypothetical protein
MDPYTTLCWPGTPERYNILRARVETASASNVGIKVRAAIQPWMCDVPRSSIEEVPEHDRAYFPSGYMPPAFYQNGCITRTLLVVSSSSPEFYRHRFSPSEGYGDKHEKYY